VGCRTKEEILRKRASAGGLGLAMLCLDGFASVAAGIDGGQLTAKTIRFAESELQVSDEADFGQLTVEVLHEKGQPIPGFTVPL
jgi:hypothetical protein